MTKLTTEELQGVLEKATPGPWAVKYNRGCTFLQTPEGDTMCDETYYPWVPDNDADWHLIAAAPDLAADRIRLEAENAALRAEVEKLRNHLMWIGARKHPKQELHPLQKMARAALGEGGE